ncbi:DUF4902 domain-containing protein [Acinetobacter baumannii]|nr:DUF4902 domain-containing protein [Acinetobacter baumannii]
MYGIRSTTYPSYALNLAQLGALCISNLCATKPYGFTEWATSQTPALSTGWDWELIENNGITTVKRVGLPRSNIMIVDVSGMDIGFDINETLLEKKIDTLFWEPFIYAQINTSLTEPSLSQTFS